MTSVYNLSKSNFENNGFTFMPALAYGYEVVGGGATMRIVNTV